jgi:hypothetical protein
VSTELINDAAATVLERWAASFRETSGLALQSIQEGDPDGYGIGELVGRYKAFEEAAAALQASADDVRGRVQPVAKPRLRAVPSTNKERDH